MNAIHMAESMHVAEKNETMRDQYMFSAFPYYTDLIETFGDSRLSTHTNKKLKHNFWIETISTLEMLSVNGLEQALG